MKKMLVALILFLVVGCSSKSPTGPSVKIDTYVGFALSLECGLGGFRILIPVGTDNYDISVYFAAEGEVSADGEIVPKSGYTWREDEYTHERYDASSVLIVFKNSACTLSPAYKIVVIQSI